MFMYVVICFPFSGLIAGKKQGFDVQVSAMSTEEAESLVRLAHSADVYNLHGAKRLVTITNVLSASCPSVNQDGENKPFLHIDCFT